MSRLLALAPLLVACQSGPSDTTTPRACSGDGSLCDRPFDEVVFAATHNSMSNADDGYAAPNQPHPIRQQLDDGIRGMLIDTFAFGDELFLCHGSCTFGATPLADVLGDFRAFLEANPNELLTLVIEDGITPEQTEGAFRDAGLLDLVIRPPTDGSWPTLGELIDADTRLLVTRESNGPGPSWYPPFYDLAFDTPYEFASVDDFTCDAFRGDSSHPLFLLNHWISDPFPDRDKDTIANSADVLGQRVADCTARWGRPPNLVAVDNYDVGDLIGVVRAANGLTP